MSEEVVYWAAPQVIERWPRLRGWIEEERPFLLWRQKLRADLADWEGNQRDPGALLIGAPLDVGRQWLARRGADLTAAERAYIEESGRQARSLRLRRMAEVAGVGLILLLSALAGLKTFSFFNEREAGQKADWYIQSGNQNLQNRNLDQAATDFTQALDVELSDSALLGRATAYLGNGNLRGALQDLELAVTTFGTAAAYLQRGQAFALQGDAARARADYDQAAKLDPDNPEVLLARGSLAQSQGDTSAAIADYSQALKLQPDSSNALFQRGLAYQQSGDLASARADFAAVLASRTADARILQAARARLGKLGTTEAAIEERGPGIVVLYGDGADEAVLAEVEHALLAQGDFSYVRVERDTEVGPLGEIRYGSTDLQARAAAAKTLIEQALANQGYPLSLNLLSEAVPAIRGSGPDRIQVSIPPLSQSNVLLPSNEFNRLPVPVPGKGPPGGGP
jgi:tetratricopeptide (TPR) repeat protein